MAATFPTDVIQCINLSATHLDHFTILRNTLFKQAFPFQGFVADLTGTGFYFNHSNTWGLSGGPGGIHFTEQTISTDGQIASGIF